jgi:parallel beta-helix repeat protein
MKRKVSTLLLILWLAVSTLTAIEFTSQTKANPYIPPEEAPPGYRIYSNGTYTAEKLHQDGAVYTFTGDINGTIIIERDHIVLDGAGYTLQGNDSSSGIWLQDRSNVTIKNLNIQNFWHGIRLSHYAPDWHTGQRNPNFTNNCTIYANNITNNTYGISQYSSLDGNILDNYVANNTHGITFSGSGNTFRNNRIEGNQYGFWDQDDGDNDVDTSNIVNGKPICYLVNQHNLTVTDDAGLVILKRCSGIRAQNLNLTGHGIGLTLYYTNNSKIIGNSIFENRNNGIALRWSYNNSIMGNQIITHQGYGIYLYESDNNTISNNLVKENSYGIEAISSRNNLISSNQIIANRGGGIYYDSSNCEVTDNYVFGNEGSGISVGSNCIVARNNITSNGPKTSAFQGAGLGFRNNCTIIDNYISNNNRGIWTYNGKGNIIAGNTIAYNNNEGIRFQGPAENNLIYHNNFIENNNDGVQATVNNVFNDPAPNAWDNGIEGNYWSDYKSVDQKTGNSTVSNTPYFVSNKNQDNHPLLTPMEFAPLELPSIQPPQEANPKPEPEPFPTTIVAASTAMLVVVGGGLLLYLKKRKR